MRLCRKLIGTTLRDSTIRVDNVCPGRFHTDRLRQRHAYKEQMAQGKSEAEVLRSIAHEIPMERAGKPEEL